MYGWHALDGRLAAGDGEGLQTIRNVSAGLEVPFVAFVGADLCRQPNSPLEVRKCTLQRGRFHKRMLLLQFFILFASAVQYVVDVKLDPCDASSLTFFGSPSYVVDETTNLLCLFSFLGVLLIVLSCFEGVDVLGPFAVFWVVV